VRPVPSLAFVGLILAACATGEEPDDTISIAGSSSSSDAGSSGNGGSQSGASGSSSTSGTTFGASGSSSGGMFGSAGAFSNGGTTLGGTTFGASGSGSGGAMGGTGGAMAGSGGAMGGTGGKAAGGNGGAAAGTGGKATGGGGSGPVGACPAKNTWTATASVEGTDCVNPTSDYCGPPARAIDDITDNRYTTSKARTGMEWLQIDFKVPTTVKTITLTTPNGDYTLAYEVRMSNDAVDIGSTAAVVSGTGQQGTTTITLPTAKTGRYLRINQTMAMSGWWSVYEMNVTCE
jgi:hypothetical protein